MVEADGCGLKRIEGEWRVGVVGEDCSGCCGGVVVGGGHASRVCPRRLALDNTAAGGAG